ncbi:hypothetical protein E1B28_003557 [Marasmius oreades]|uniref:Uncharacterized protein n=1 Tax=Marasmius oreades TaxID=181124 RepID=A0A9P7RLR9_9AGAR|nr:uncharacterized protein E1B28_003557 [Marasmius oreades]KAG7086036.1 hypothetical protein E1B28_003557 [Marasmius oreades]
MIEDRLAPYFSIRGILTYPIATLIVMFLLYGFYIAIFALSLRVLLRRNNPISRIYLALVITLFVLATLANICEATGLIQQAVLLLSVLKSKDYFRLIRYLQHDAGKTALSVILNLTNVVMNVIADFMLIHRCYSIWGSNELMLYSLGLIAFVINGTILGSLIAASVGYNDTSVLSNVLLFEKANKINTGSWLAVAAFNLLLTLLMAGRIWWITREIREVMGKPIVKRYHKLVAVILESGILYSTALLTSIAVNLALDPDDHGYLPIDLSVITYQMSGIAPTLIIVRIAYRKMVETSIIEGGPISTLHFAARSLEVQQGSKPEV